ncbi:MAG: serine/threonine-protein kinase [Verrucomicrobiota bacterium]
MSEASRLLKILFDSLTNLERPEEREAFLDHTCRENPELRQRLERMFALRHDARDFFDVETAAPPPGESAGDDATEGVGARIGRYRLIERLGEGGCGVVYLAEQQEPVVRRVALKIIRLGMDTESVIARFEMERQSLAMMDHPNIARVLDVGATRTGRPYFVMQLVDGEKITDYCNEKRLGIPQRLKLFIRICQAIQHAHQKGVIHRDIKPSNILIWENDGEPVPKVIDFGIAKATAAGLDESATFTAAGQFVGTPAYMSPEQASGNGLDVDTRSDIFSLGALLYEILTGKPPFDSQQLKQSGAEEIHRILTEVEPREPSSVIATLKPPQLAETAAQRACDPQKLAGLLRGDLDRIVMKALAKDRKHRYATADALATDVTRYLNNEPVAARSPSRFYRFAKLVRRNKAVFATSAIVLLSLIVGLGTATWMFLRETQARDAAERARANEAALRQKAEFGEKIAHAAVLLKYNKIQEADELLAGIPPAMTQPSLEAADTFGMIGFWHAREGRWKKAADRFAALAYSITSVDGSDNDAISLTLLAAAAATCEAGDFAAYENLRSMALERFGDTSNPIVAEQVIKACLLLPADRKMMAKLDPLEALLVSAHANLEATTPGERNLAAWREFAIGLMEFRKGDLDLSTVWIGKCTTSTNENPSRDAMAWTLRAMIGHRQGRVADARSDVESARAVIEERFATKLGIFENSEPQWQDWVNARMLLHEADSLIGK